MDWEEKNILITGANGFVGSWLAKALVKKKANVVVILRDFVPDSTLRLEETFEKLKAAVRGDILDYDLVKRTFNEYNIDTCFHLAAQAIVGVANKSPTGTFAVNINGTWNMLEAARNSKSIERVIVASTDKVYGEPIKLPITEDHPLLASYPYDASKACADILSRAYFKTYGLPLAVTRCSNIYGGGDLNFSRIVPDTIRSIIFGKDLLIRSDGTPERDYIYIKDVVSAYLTLTEQLDKKEVKGEAFNFATETPTSVLEIFNKIIKLSGKNVKPVILNEAKAEIQRQFLAIGKAKRILGWEPKYSLDEGIKETIEWYKDFFARKKTKK